MTAPIVLEWYSVTHYGTEHEYVSDGFLAGCIVRLLSKVTVTKHDRMLLRDIMLHGASEGTRIEWREVPAPRKES